ncbi:MAG: SDR family oxidoreductase [Gammaproteobacteria bacterium]|nr:SDR family oxidoreductase [Gammaproteobacteria bacterium]
MDLGLKGKRALITGASKGIGRAVATVLAAEGCDLHLVARSAELLAAAATELEATCACAVRWSALDLADSANLDTLCAAAGDIDILVNNAGAIPAGTLDMVDEATWRAAWDLKVFGYINLTRRVYAAMRGRGGVIVNVIGAGGERVSAGYLAGAGGNAALMGVTRALGGVSLRDGIRVVGINPGLIETERLVTMQRTHASRVLGDAERWREMLDPDFPPGQPAHIADMVAFLASPRSGNTTGTIITIDGGMCAR